MQAKAKAKFPKSPRLEITIDPDHLRNAIERNSGHCLISDAISAQVPWAAGVSTDLQTIRITHRERGLRYAYLTPRSCQIALLMFDQGRRKELRPFTFRLRGAQIAWANTKRARANKTQAGLTVPRRASLIPSNEGRGRVVARRIGGKLPPKFSAGKRREFGIRAMSAGYPVGSPENPGRNAE